MKQRSTDDIPFWQHLEELRWTVFKCLGILTLSTVLGFAFTGVVYQWVLYPVRDYLSEELTGRPFTSTPSERRGVGDLPSNGEMDEWTALLQRLAQPDTSPETRLDLQTRGLALLHERLENLHDERRGGGRRIRIVYSSPVEPFTVKLKVAFLGGVAFAVPFVGYCLWGFVAPGLRENERRLVRGSLGLATLLFILGGAFGYAFLPLGIPALLAFAAPGVEQIWPLDAYIGFCVRLIVAFGLVFEMPLAIALAARLEWVDAATLVRGRPYATVLFFVLAALLTPPDLYSQVALAIPMIGLYEIGILVARRSGRKEPT